VVGSGRPIAALRVELRRIPGAGRKPLRQMGQQTCICCWKIESTHLGGRL